MLACRETNELRREERDRALAMASLLNGLPMTSSDNDSALTADDNSFRESVKSALHNTPLAGLAVAAAGWGIPEKDLLTGFAFSYAEALVYAALKLVPFGQLDAQTILLSLDDQFAESVQYAIHDTSELPVYSCPAVTFASVRHETQYSRLFRS